MKKILLFCLLFVPLSVAAQQETDYNQKGDEAMKRKDYREARMWYEEGAASCNTYSINQLTYIWVNDESMRVSMRTVMRKCQTCLSDLAVEQKDTTAMKRLVSYYEKGVVEKNEAAANYWRTQLDEIRNPYVATMQSQSSKERMKFFVGYEGSIDIAPFGLQVGGLGDKIGWYARFRTNMSVRSATEGVECKDSNGGTIPAFDSNKTYYRFTDGAGKANTLIGTAGMMFKTVPNLYLSVGGGYWMRNILYEYETYDGNTLNVLSTGWAKNVDASRNGVAIDLDLTGVAGIFYGTIGCSVLNFEYVYPSVGIGFVF
ncbi:MAG: hypothetical protein LBN71_04715 [Tannerella sp.]|nr:hypothetical protein [Tannerella sp.]